MTRIVGAGKVEPLAPGWHFATGAALAANLVGIGLARFGYTPLIPALIAAKWLAPSAAAYLGAANLAGYLVGAVAAGRIAGRLGPRAVLRMAMVLTAASLIACAVPFGFWWFFPWRVLSGSTGGVLMALAAPIVLPQVPSARRGAAGGAIFTGVGLGIAGSGTLIPILMLWGLVATWLGLGVLAAILTVFAWGGFPATGGAPDPAPHRRGRPGAALQALYIEYALNAVALVPHMVFLVDYIARGLDRGLHQAAQFWVVFGLGALLGPMIGGTLGDRIGFRAMLRIGFVVQAGCIALPLLSTGTVSLAVSSFVVGAFVPGSVAITIGRARELAGRDPAVQATAWRWCTIAFALGQAIAGYGFSYIFARAGGGYALLFLIGAAALLTALLIDFWIAGSGGRAVAEADR